MARHAAMILLGLTGLLLAASPTWSTVIVKQTKDGSTVSVTGGWSKKLGFMHGQDLTFHDKSLADNAAKYLNEAEDLAVKNDKAGFDHALINLSAVADIAKVKYDAASKAYWEAVQPIYGEVSGELKKPSILDYKTSTPNENLNKTEYEKFLKAEDEYKKSFEAKVQDKVNKNPKLAALYKEFKIAESDHYAAFYLNFDYAENKGLFLIIRSYYSSTDNPPNKNAANGQTAAPKTCGEVTDSGTLLAMGCIPDAQNRAATVTRTQAAATGGRSDRTEGCLNDPVCIRALEERQRESGGASKRDMPPPSGAPGMPMSGPARY